MYTHTHAHTHAHTRTHAHTCTCYYIIICMTVHNAQIMHVHDLIHDCNRHKIILSYPVMPHPFLLTQEMGPLFVTLLLNASKPRLNGKSGAKLRSPSSSATSSSAIHADLQEIDLGMGDFKEANSRPIGETTKVRSSHTYTSCLCSVHKYTEACATVTLGGSLRSPCVSTYCIIISIGNFLTWHE